jgi:hypothetical protein
MGVCSSHNNSCSSLVAYAFHYKYIHYFLLFFVSVIVCLDIANVMFDMISNPIITMLHFGSRVHNSP